MDIEKYLDANMIDYNYVAENKFEIKDIGVFLIVNDKDEVFDELMNLNLTEDEENESCDFFVYQFGSKVYYTPTKKIESFSIFKYIGVAYKEYYGNYPHLGVHGGYDILNGSRSYKDWCKKAKFLGIETLGICEKNTLAGVLKFQKSCIENNIKPIIGGQYTVHNNEETTNIKVYVKNEIGWRNILLINAEVNVFNSGFIERKRLFELVEGLIVVIDPKYIKHGQILPFSLNIFSDLYWQMEDVEFENDNNDKEYLTNISSFLKDKTIHPILINDSYYLDSDEWQTKEILNNISDKRDYKSKNQYFKSITEILENLSLLFTEDDLFDTFEKVLENTNKVVNGCNFIIPTGLRLLPEYTLTKEEIVLYGDKENMFLSLVEKGIDVKLANKSNIEEYLKRIETEYEVIAEFGFIDYFLILWDIVKWSMENNILVGVGRGSSAGSLLSYLLGITQVDPLPFGLLFERFLNRGRAKKSLPDLDVDFEGLRREDVKKYMEDRYGKESVCSVGTYTNLKIKQSFKDLSRLHSVEFGTSNYISSIFDIEDGGWEEIIKTAQEKKQVKDFVKNHVDLIEEMQLILNQPKSKSIHACATIILPKGKTLYSTIPVRLEKKDLEDIIVSEWEGSEIEYAGYLKEDILGIKQLDKYRFIVDSIKNKENFTLDLNTIPLNDKEAIQLFREGKTGDIFHFGSPGLTGYCQKLKPENINDLIAAIALYRPGAMDVNSHNEYILRKNGERDVIYHFGIKDITKETYGLLCYQEQIMKIFQVLADYTLEEADDIRKSLGKKIKSIMEEKKAHFLQKCIEKGCKEDEAKVIWHEIEVHANYSFNKAHAVSYAIMGYRGQWLKVHYPIHFWSAAFQFDNQNPKLSNSNRYISEINKSDYGIKIKSPHINESGETFTSNFEKKEIYWSINKVSGLGEKALESIITERNKNGEFFTFEEFLSRINKSVVNKTVVINLIFSGAFDDIEKIESIEKRIELIKKYHAIQKTKDKDIDKTFFTNNKFFWQMKQKEVCKFGDIDYVYLIRTYTDFKVKDYVDGFEIQSGEYIDKRKVIAGIVTRIVERKSKKTGEYAFIEMESNYEKINVTLWSEVWNEYKEKIIEDSILVMSGVIFYDKFRECYSVQSHNFTKIYIK